LEGGSGIFIGNSSLVITLAIPRLMLSAVEARTSRPGVAEEARKDDSLKTLGVFPRGVKVNWLPAGAKEERNMGRGDAAAEKFVALMVLAESLPEGPCGRSIILRPDS
jgi:hypothetical protein